MPALCFTHVGSLYKNKLWIYKQHFYIGIYITGKTHEGGHFMADRWGNNGNSG